MESRVGGNVGVRTIRQDTHPRQAMEIDAPHMLAAPAYFLGDDLGNRDTTEDSRQQVEPANAVEMDERA
jgi:hypothetical protein